MPSLRQALWSSFSPDLLHQPLLIFSNSRGDLSTPSCAKHHVPWGQNRSLHFSSLSVQSALLYSETFSPSAPLILSSLLFIAGDNREVMVLWSSYPKIMPVRLCPPDAIAGMLLLPTTALAGPFLQQAAGCSAPVTELKGMLSSIWRFTPRVHDADMLLPPLGWEHPAMCLAHSCHSFANVDRLLGCAASLELPGYQLYWAGWVRRQRKQVCNCNRGESCRGVCLWMTNRRCKG